MTLDLTRSSLNGWQVVTITGQIDSKTVSTLRDFLGKEVKVDEPLALELSGVPFMSSAGLRTMLTLERQTKSHGVDLALLGLRSEIADTMKVTGFYQYFTTYQSANNLPSKPEPST